MEEKRIKYMQAQNCIQ